MIILFDILLFFGAATLLYSLLYARRIIQTLSAGSLRNQWYVLIFLITFFALGYIGCIIFFPQGINFLVILLVGTVFFFGACFVFITVRLALLTVNDLRRISTLEQENIMDPLIKIFNRRYFNQRIDYEFARAERYEHPLSLILLDLDNFKNVNDIHGHRIGDMVLVRLGEILMTIVRKTDIVARYGGEEIIVITPNTCINGAEILAERLRKIIEQTVFVPSSDTFDNAPLLCTVSIGVSSRRKGMREASILIQEADEALYRAKHEGRNRVVLTRHKMAVNSQGC